MLKSHTVSQAGRWLYGIESAFFAWVAVETWPNVAAWRSSGGMLVVLSALCAAFFLYSAVTGRDWRWGSGS